MAFDSFVGNKLAIAMLRRALESERIASAYLFHGPDGVGKSLAALNFAKAMLCERGGTDSCGVCSSCRRVDSGNHPDVHWHRPLGKMRVVTIGEVREITSQAALKAFEGGWKIFVVVDADRMKIEAQNAILKTLEEPPGRSVLILVSSNPAGLLPTIVSRCQGVAFLPIERGELETAIAQKWGLDEDKARLVASLAGGSIGSASRLLERDNLSRRTLLLNLLVDAPERSFREIFSTVRAVDGELKELRDELSEREERRVKGMGKALSAEDREAWLERSEAVIASTVREEVEDVLNLLAFWYRDLLLINKGVSADLVTNFDMVGALRKAAAGTTASHILNRLKAVEEARRAIALNVPLAFCLEVLYVTAGEAQENKGGGSKKSDYSLRP